jgi:hypothetical protein
MGRVRLWHLPGSAFSETNVTSYIRIRHLICSNEDRLRFTRTRIPKLIFDFDFVARFVAKAGG